MNAGKGQFYRRHNADEICCRAVRLVVALMRRADALLQSRVTEAKQTS
jgi:hypothetical protein